MDSILALYNQTLFIFSSLTWLGIIDLALVTGAFYFLLSLVQRSSAAYLRDILVLGVVLFVLTTLLPLPVFDWLVRGLLVAMLVATPIIFQAQLRRFIERIGRTAGIAQAVRQDAAAKVLPEIVHAVETMSAGRTGALIALEGRDSLEEIAQSGVPFNGRVTSELLLSIFYPGTPLHDGAVIIRTDQIFAAGCVLPLTQQSLQSDKRLGTRHRAAVGLSETSDTLVIVASEETGTIALARHGELLRPLSIGELRDVLLDFYEPASVSSTLPLWSLIGQAGRGFCRSMSPLKPRQFLSNIGLFMVAFLLAVVVWSFVIEQTDSIRRVRVENIPLRVENIPSDTKLMPTPPSSVSAVIQTTEEVLPTLSSRSFQAVVSLPQPTPGLYRLPVRVNSGPAQVLVLSTDPSALDMELTPIISRSVPVSVQVLDQQSLSAAYELLAPPVSSPEQVQIIGPAPLIEQVNQVQTSISLANAAGSLRETRPLRVLDEQGHEITGVTVQPDQVQVGVSIRRQVNARDVSVRVVTQGNPPPDYWLSKLSVTPAGITLQGKPDQLAGLGNFVDTLPVDVSHAMGDLSWQIPLDLPPEVRALDSNGNFLPAVTVSARVEARSGNLAVTRSIELVSATPGLTVTVEPRQVDLLLSGPLPVLNEIEANPKLVRTVVDVTQLNPGQTTELTPQVIVPAGIDAQLALPTVVIKPDR
ncbi:MAG: diadenylate cyclase CdaA [Chloroflexota bacterium]